MDFTKSIRSFFFMLDKVIYTFTGYVFDFMMDLAKTNFFTGREFSDLIKRIYTLIGIIILFKMAFSLISIVVNPDKALDNKGGSANQIVPRVIITISLLLVTQYIFDAAYYVQSVILKENVIPRLITGAINNLHSEVVVMNEVCEFQFDSNVPLYYEDPGCINQDICNYTPIPNLNKGQAINDITLNPSGFLFKTEIPAGSKIIADLGNNTTYFYHRNSVFPNMLQRYIEEGKLDAANLTTELSIHKIVSMKDGSFKCNANGVTTLSLDGGSEEHGDPYLPNKITKINTWTGIIEYNSSTSNMKLIDSTAGLRNTYTLTTGRDFAGRILFGFIQPEAVNENSRDPLDPDIGSYYESAKKDSNYAQLDEMVTKTVSTPGTPNGKTFSLNYMFLISTMVGILVLLLLVSSCFDIALRSIVLVFLQVIAPIPISSYIEYGNTSGKLFSNYVNYTLTTYFDIFIRILCISFSTYIMQIGSNIKVVGSMTYNSSIYETLIKMFIVFGGLLFIKQAPTILGKIIGLKDFGNGMFNFNPLRKLQEVPVGGALALGGIGAAVGLAGAGAGIIGGKLSGAQFDAKDRWKFAGGLALGALNGLGAGLTSVPIGGVSGNAKVSNPFTRSYRSGINSTRGVVYDAYTAYGKNPLKQKIYEWERKVNDAEIAYSEVSKKRLGVLDEISNRNPNLMAINQKIASARAEMTDLESEKAQKTPRYSQLIANLKEHTSDAYTIASADENLKNLQDQFMNLTDRAESSHVSLVKFKKGKKDATEDFQKGARRAYGARVNKERDDIYYKNNK